MDRPILNEGAMLEYLQLGSTLDYHKQLAIEMKVGWYD